MQKAINYMPNNTRTYYNLSLLYSKNEDNKNAEKTLLKGLKIDGNNESLLYALAFHYFNTNQTNKARNILLKLINLFPDNRQYSNFLRQLE